ncbi:MAG: hypothetical protein ACTHN4_07510 [Sphingomicrobium sp.]
MKLAISAAFTALALAATGCSQGNSDNVMSPEANALQPADVNAALGPEVTNTPDMNMTANDTNAAGNESNMAYPPDEPGMANNSSQ